MKKHFEVLWEEAERQHLQLDPTFQLTDKFAAIRADLTALEAGQDVGASFGRLLYNLCAVSQKLNVNTFAALVKELQNQKVDALQDT